MGVQRRSGAIGILFGTAMAFTLLATSCGNDTEEEAAGEDVVQESDFVVEAPTDPGQGAFTAPVDIAPADDPLFGFRRQDDGGGTVAPGQDPTQAPPVQAPGGCDKEAFKAELANRPEAKKEWAATLEVPEDQVDPYIDGLEPQILATDMKVTNHGLSEDGKAFPILSTLEGGTAVLVDKNDSGKTANQPVTRCKCGNPLLKAPEIGEKRPEWVTTTTGDTTTSSTSSTTSSTTTSSTTTSSTTTTLLETTTTFFDDTTTSIIDRTTTGGGTDGSGTDSGTAGGTDGSDTDGNVDGGGTAVVDTGGAVVDGGGG